MNGQLTDKGITEAQLKELDKLLVELNKPIKNGYPCYGDDEAMIKAVTNAANYYDGKENTFLEDLVHIKSSYTN